MPRSLPPLHLLLLLGTLGGWATPTSAKTLRIGVPAKSPYPPVCGRKMQDFERDMFQRPCHRRLPVGLEESIQQDYEFIPYEGHYDTLIDRVVYKKLDTVVGDTSIAANRTRYMEYSRPYTQTGARMVVLEKREVQAWIFVKPFTGTLWVATGAFFLYNGIIVWLIESTDVEEKRFSFNHICNLIWLSFTTLFPFTVTRDRESHAVSRRPRPT
ncbi:glutamate receptor 2.6-like [Magnolia sinica]|uniref:glutamate receptor 2.6-like n=1 Tax=Magnolia sinica TaxID=86752 RepID=UPI002658ED7B|nr:glutamate receptor 2.6-like [Magnolia sinica]